MKSALNTAEESANMPPANDLESAQLSEVIAQSWSKIAPFWPLKNLIAVNPLSGFEDMAFEEAYRQGAVYFQQKNMPDTMHAVNRETIKWLQAFFDEGQATIQMPLRHHGLYAAFRNLAPFDGNLHGHNQQKLQWLEKLPDTAEAAIAECLFYLGIPGESRLQFLTLALTTLPGWAAHVQYRTSWADEADASHPHPVTQAGYLAVRLVITCLMWPGAKALLDWHAAALKDTPENFPLIKNMEKTEKEYRLALLEKLSAQRSQKPDSATAQLVFCIDVRSEPFRRALEAQGRYETFGFAGFFGVPVSIENEMTGERYASCPVLLKPQHHIKERPCPPSRRHAGDRAGYKKLQGFKRLYQSVKYTFTSPFALVETLGVFSGLWMSLRSLAPGLANRLKRKAVETIRPSLPLETETEGIPHADQCSYAEGALRMMGLTQNFAPLVVLCGHCSTTQNNAYATALDCGACGGRHGASNARILAGILNDAGVRTYLRKAGISIPETTCFIAAEHNTTTDEVDLYTHKLPEAIRDRILDLQADLNSARKMNSEYRARGLGVTGDPDQCARETALRSQDWAQVRPEWGLAGNAAFIVAPRRITQAVELEGRSFLHSYDWTQDPEGDSLTTILTAPMVVAQWINSQYLFSALDNVAYGGGSKITKNITGKIGIMQGNASDLMTGLPLQSVYQSDTETYHQPLRLMTVVYAPRAFIDKIIAEQEVLRKLFGNGWVTLACIEPEDGQSYFLQRDMTWVSAH